MAFGVDNVLCSELLCVLQPSVENIDEDRGQCAEMMVDQQKVREDELASIDASVGMYNDSNRKVGLDDTLRYLGGRYAQ